MIYFDNSATSLYKPSCVIGAVCNTLKYASANPGRASHVYSMRAAKIVSCARSNAAEFFGLKNPDNCIFTLNCTMALNLAVMGTAKRGRIITTALEHNSVLRTLHSLQSRTNSPLTIIYPNSDGIITANMIEKKLSSDVYMVAITHTSNVLGTTNPIREIGELLKGKGILFLVDCAQSAGHIKIDIEKDNIDMMAVAAHKGLHAPQGVGMLLFREHVPLVPIFMGGTGVDSLNLNQESGITPESFEAGTLPTPIIAGLNAALNFTRENFSENAEKTKRLSLYQLEQLAALPFVELYTPLDTTSGVASFNIKNMNSNDVAGILSKDYGIAVRAGLHCAPLAHEYLGTIGRGAIRSSLAFDNTLSEIDCFITALKEIARSTP